MDRLLRELRAGQASTWTPERFLAGIAVLSPADRAELARRAVSMQVARKAPWSPVTHLLIGLVDPTANRANDLMGWATALPNLLPTNGSTGLFRELFDKVRTFGRPQPAEGLDAIFSARVAEVAKLIEDEVSVELLAYPDVDSGHIRPERLLRDLNRFAVEGIEPGPADLEQVVLRLPADDWPFDALTELHSIDTPAANWLALAIAAGPLPGPEVQVYETKLFDESALATLVTWNSVAQRDWPLLRAARALPQLNQPEIDTHQRQWFAVRAQAVPSQRELVAAHLLRLIISDAPGVDSVTLLPVLDGPIGPSALLCLAYEMAAKAPTRRAKAVTVVHELAEAGQLDADALGRTMSSVTGVWRVKINRWAKSLIAYAELGPTEARFAWQVLAVLLTDALATVLKDRSGATILLRAAIRIAGLADARGALPGLSDITRSGRSSKTVALANQLQAQLAAPTS